MNKKTALFFILSLIVLASCKSEYNAVLKTDDVMYKYEYAKECYANHKYLRASDLFGSLVNVTKNTDNGEECLYMYALSAYKNKDFESASEVFKKYFVSYPRGKYAEEACYNIAQSLYESTPEPRLDQSDTYLAIKAYQDFLDIYQFSEKKEEAQQRLYELQDKLVKKELLSARLYYNMGTYFGNCTSGGNNYEACIVTAQNALKDYPYSNYREDFALLIMKSKYELAQQSIESKRMERFQDAEEECYGFINEYPESHERSLAEKYIERCKKVTKDAVD